MIQNLEGDGLFLPGAGSDIEAPAEDLARALPHAQAARWLGDMASRASMGACALATHDFVLRNQLTVEQVGQLASVVTFGWVVFGATSRGLYWLADRWDLATEM